MPDEVECLPSFDPSYSRPPIIEAVIEIRLLEAVGASDLARVSEQFAPCYPNEQKHSDMDFAITPDASGQPQTERIGSVDWLRRSSQDDREVALLKPGAMAIADRAPYSGWEKFFTRFQRDWALWTNIIGHRTHARVGMRYINRIDIPIRKDDRTADGSFVIRHEDYIPVYVKAPEDKFGPSVSYEARATYRSIAIGGQFMLRTGIIQPQQVPDHMSVVLDIDVARHINLPQTDKELVALLDAMRVEKNRVFELCLTDQARELFR